MTKEHREPWSPELGVIVAVSGSAVGLLVVVRIGETGERAAAEVGHE